MLLLMIFLRFTDELRCMSMSAIRRHSTQTPCHGPQPAPDEPLRHKRPAAGVRFWDGFCEFGIGRAQVRLTLALFAWGRFNPEFGHSTCPGAGCRVRQGGCPAGDLGVCERAGISFATADERKDFERGRKLSNIWSWNPFTAVAGCGPETEDPVAKWIPKEALRRQLETPE